MFLVNLMYFLKGYVSIKVFGRKAEKFINIAIERNIGLWNIKRKNNHISMNISIKGYKELWFVARKLNIPIRLVKKRGFPFLLHKLWRRKVFAFGLILFILTLYILSSLIWFVEVEGLQTINHKEFTEFIKEENLKVGKFKFHVDSDGLEHKLIVKYPEIAWVSVNITGTQVLVEVVEKDPAAASEKGPSNIIAARDGVISRILALSGQEEVVEGQTVIKGQTLITGQMFNKETRTHMLVRSFGIVEAKVWYEGYGEAKNEEKEYNETGNTYIVTYVNTFGKRLKIPKKPVPFEKYTRVEEINPLKIGKSKLPIGIITITYNEIKMKEVKHNIKAMETIAYQRALEAVKHKLPKGTKIENETITVIEKDPKIVRIKVILESIEDIGKLQRIN